MPSPEQRAASERRGAPDEAPPLVSVGIPVFNGENYLEAAIRSVLTQTLGDLELIVSDNASEDRTEEICRDWAARDRRLRYARNPTNLGAAPNYNRAFELARGRYFKWLAHDDMLAPTYLARTVAALEARPELVTCNTLVEYVDATGNVLGLYDSDLGAADRPSPAERLAAIILRPHVVDFFGVHRRRAMQGTLLHGSFHGGDRAFLAQMALRGRLAPIKEPLLRMREHAERYTHRTLAPRERAAWHDARNARRVSLPTLRLFAEYWRSVRDADLAPGERRRCRWLLGRWWLSNWNAVRAAVDVVAVIAPGVVGVAENVKTRLFGTPRGLFVDLAVRARAQARAGISEEVAGRAEK